MASPSTTSFTSWSVADIGPAVGALKPNCMSCSLCCMAWCSCHTTRCGRWRLALSSAPTGVLFEVGHGGASQADGGCGAAARSRPWPADLVLTQGLHSVDQALPRRVPLLHLRRDAACQPPSLSLARRSLGDRPRRQGGGLHRGAVHPGRQA